MSIWRSSEIRDSAVVGEMYNHEVYSDHRLRMQATAASIHACRRSTPGTGKLPNYTFTTKPTSAIQHVLWGSHLFSTSWTRTDNLAHREGRIGHDVAQNVHSLVTEPCLALHGHFSRFFGIECQCESAVATRGRRICACVCAMPFWIVSETRNEHPRARGGVCCEAEFGGIESVAKLAGQDGLDFRHGESAHHRVDDQWRWIQIYAEWCGRGAGYGWDG